MYFVGFPGWKLAARLNIPLLFRIEVMHDEEAGVYVAKSKDLKGLVVESSSREELLADVYDAADMLLAKSLAHPPRTRPAAAWTGEFLPA